MLASVVVICIAVAAQSGPTLITVKIPQYPPVARQARVQGIVKLTFSLAANQGEPTNMEVVSGHPLLNACALENVKSWKFENPYKVERKYDTTLEFRFSSEEMAGRGKTSVTFDSFHHILVLADPPAPFVNY